ncbi:TfoX/Sxy family protein [soil metagenome]
MAVSPDYAAYVLEQLGRTGATSRKMFGGMGLYIDGLFFALIDDDCLYFKVDEQTRADFAGRDTQPWMPPGATWTTPGYMSVPSEVIEDPDDLTEWARKAVGVAARKAAKKPQPKPRQPKTKRKS